MKLEDVVSEIADVLFQTWSKAEPNHSITQHPTSYTATFRDMARAVLEKFPERVSAQAESGNPDNSFRDAIDEALIVNCLDCIGPNETAQQALARLVSWEVQIALDPAVSPEAQALIDLGVEKEQMKTKSSCPS